MNIRCLLTLCLVPLVVACEKGKGAEDITAGPTLDVTPDAADGGGPDRRTAADLPDSIALDDLPAIDGESLDVTRAADLAEIAESAADGCEVAEGEIDACSDVAEPPENPFPVPALSDEVPPTCQAAIDDPWYFQFLDNLCDDKVYPSDPDPDRACPTVDSSPLVTLADGTQVLYRPSAEEVVWDTHALDGVLPEGLSIAVILIKRVDGVPHYRYLTNGTHGVAMQPWSTTKFLAIANAAATLRIVSDYKVGLTATVKGIPVGDLVTSVHNYDHDPYSSNGLGAWFHDVGGRDRANDLIHDLWLDRPAQETFGGNYGEAPPPLGYTFLDSGATVTVEKDTTTGISNHLSMWTLAEGLKRLVLHMEEPGLRLPGLQWADIRILLFGAEGSTKYGTFGGMTADTAVYIQSGHDMSYIEERSQGQWVIFSKLGLGSQGQFLNVGYACFPVLDEAGNPVPGWGREFVIAAHLDQGGSTWDERDRILATAYRKIILRIVDGRI